MFCTYIIMVCRKAFKALFPSYPVIPFECIIMCLFNMNKIATFISLYSCVRHVSFISWIFSIVCKCKTGFIYFQGLLRPRLVLVHIGQDGVYNASWIVDDFDKSKISNITVYWCRESNNDGICQVCWSRPICNSQLFLVLRQTLFPSRSWISYIKLFYSFLAHLSQRLEWAIVIAHRPSSVRPSVVRRPCGVNFSHFRLLLQNCLMDFDETW